MVLFFLHMLACFCFFLTVGAKFFLQVLVISYFNEYFFLTVQPHSILPRLFFPASQARLGAWLQPGTSAWLVEASRGREWRSNNEEEPARWWSNIGAGGEEHLYNRTHLQEERRQESRRSPGVTFSDSVSVFKANSTATATQSPTTFHSKCLRVAGFSPRGVSF